MNDIYITGDTHAEFKRFSNANWDIAKDLDETDVLIVLGDFGLIWSLMSDKNEIYWTKWFDSKKFTTVFIPGNHENYDRLFSKEFDRVEKYGKEVTKISEKIFMLDRGQSYMINGKSFLAIGGAESIDKSHRLNHISWWSDELLSTKETDLLFENIENKSDYDYILSHTAPTNIVRALGFSMFKDGDPTCKILDEVQKRVTFKEWYFGHMHLNIVIDSYLGLFKNIIKI